MSIFITRALFLAPLAILLLAAFGVAWLIEAMSDLASGSSASEKTS
jgi:hypothetical protein